MLVTNMISVFGRRLIGSRVMTEQHSDYPGGEAVVTVIHPDIHPDDLPWNIVMIVDHPREGSVGIFENAQVWLMEPVSQKIKDYNLGPSFNLNLCIWSGSQAEGRSCRGSLKPVADVVDQTIRKLKLD